MMATKGGPSNFGGAFKADAFVSCTLRSGTDGQPGAVYDSQEILPNRGLRSRKYFIKNVRSNEMLEYDELLVDKYDYSGDEDKAAKSTTRIFFGPCANGDLTKCTMVFDAPKMNFFDLASHWSLMIVSPMLIPVLFIAGPCIYRDVKQSGRRCLALTGKYLANLSGGALHGGVAQMTQNMTATLNKGETAQGEDQGLTSAQTGLPSAQITGGRIG
jgi:hypothetical protein